jgi:septal ring factor EnvC (AmiA/AmiB activator)
MKQLLAAAALVALAAPAMAQDDNPFAPSREELEDQQIMANQQRMFDQMQHSSDESALAAAIYQQRKKQQELEARIEQLEQEVQQLRRGQ